MKSADFCELFRDLYFIPAEFYRFFWTGGNAFTAFDAQLVIDHVDIPVRSLDGFLRTRIYALPAACAQSRIDLKAYKTTAFSGAASFSDNMPVYIITEIRCRRQGGQYHVFSESTQRAGRDQRTNILDKRDVFPGSFALRDVSENGFYLPAPLPAQDTLLA
jgi:hypothetical protein